MKLGIDKIKKIIQEETNKVLSEQAYGDKGLVQTLMRGTTGGIGLGADTKLKLDPDLDLSDPRKGRGDRGPRDRGRPSVTPKLNDPVSVFRAVHSWNPYPGKNLGDLNDRKRNFAIQRFNILVQQLKQVLHAAHKQKFSNNLQGFLKGPGGSSISLVDRNAKNARQYISKPYTGMGGYRVGRDVEFRHQVGLAFYVLEEVSRGVPGIDFSAEEELKAVVDTGRKEFKPSESDLRKYNMTDRAGVFAKRLLAHPPFKFKQAGRGKTLGRLTGTIKKLADPDFVNNLISK